MMEAAKRGIPEEQLRSLQWMRGQEAINARPWVEQEIEEATISHWVGGPKFAPQRRLVFLVVC